MISGAHLWASRTHEPLRVYIVELVGDPAGQVGFVTGIACEHHRRMAGRCCPLVDMSDIC